MEIPYVVTWSDASITLGGKPDVCLAVSLHRCRLDANAAIEVWRTGRLVCEQRQVVSAVRPADPAVVEWANVT